MQAITCMTLPDPGQKRKVHYSPLWYMWSPKENRFFSPAGIWKPIGPQTRRAAEHQCAQGMHGMLRSHTPSEGRPYHAQTPA